MNGLCCTHGAGAALGHCWRAGLLLASVATPLASLMAAPGAAPMARAPRTEAGDIARYSAQPAPEWTQLFDRREGWTGADGVYSIPLSGDERPGSGASSRTLIMFSDSFVGTVNADGSRTATTMVNNTTATLTGAKPEAEKLVFNVRTRGGKAISMVEPGQTRFAGEWFWPADGVMSDGNVYVYALRMKTADTPPFSFASSGVSLLGARASDDAPFLGPYTQVNTPLFAPSDASGRKETTFGLAVMPLTIESAAPNPDGYLYIYGTRSGTYQKSMVVARVRPEQITDFSAYRYWDGADWVDNKHRAVTIAKGVSPEFSVQPLDDGRFLIVHMTDLLGSTVAVRYGQSPVGPWGKDIPIWDCPEIGMTPDTFVYGAKAHPHLSTPGSLLISYHVNTFDFWENFAAGGSEIYRPRFITVPLP